MRIIAGEFRGRTISCPRTLAIRPTSDRVRESLFNILGEVCSGSQVLDLYAGVGTVGLEAVSRGAEHVTFVDYAHQSIRYLRKNLDCCRERTDVVPADVGVALKALSKKGLRYDIVFLDPPYERGMVQTTLDALNALPLAEQNTLIIAQHSRREAVKNGWQKFGIADTRSYGDTVITFLRGNA